MFWGSRRDLEVARDVGPSAKFERRFSFPNDGSHKVLTDSKNFVALHLRWFLGFIIASGGAAIWYLSEAAKAGRWPGGSSATGWVFGLLAGAIVLFEFTLWFRQTKWFRTSRLLGSAQLWMKAHIWLGLLTVPLVFFHSGFGFGGQFTSVLTWTFVVVIASGLLGLFLQNVVPRLLLEQVPVETVYSQIGSVATQYAEEAARIVALTCGERFDDNGRSSEHARLHSEVETTPVIGARRRVGTILQRSPDGNVEFGRVTSAQPLLLAFTEDIRPFLLSGRSVGSRLASRRKCQAYFIALRQLVGADGHGAVDAVAELCDRRRDLNLQRRLHYALHGWRAVHLPVSVALVLLLIVHVLYAIRIG